MRALSDSRAVKNVAHGTTSPPTTTGRAGASAVTSGSHPVQNFLIQQNAAAQRAQKFQKIYDEYRQHLHMMHLQRLQNTWVNMEFQWPPSSNTVGAGIQTSTLWPSSITTEKETPYVSKDGPLEVVDLSILVKDQPTR